MIRLRPILKSTLVILALATFPLSSVQADTSPTPPVSPLQVSFECVDGSEEVEASIIYQNALYPESPLLRNGSLYFVEFGLDQITEVFRPGVGPRHLSRAVWSKAGCGPAAVAPYQDNQFLVACYNQNSIVQLSANGEEIKTFSSSPSLPMKGPNDFTLDSNGGVYFTASGVFERSSPIEGEIYYLSPGPNSTLTKVAQGIHYSNGIGLIQGGNTLLVSEHFKNRILKYRVISPGVLAQNPEVFADLGQVAPPQADLSGGYQGPDGMRVLSASSQLTGPSSHTGPAGQTESDLIVIAQFGGARLIKLNSEGKLVGVISFETPYPNNTNVWIDGNHLYASLVGNSRQSSESPPGIIIRIDDPQLRTRARLQCRINPS